MIEPIDFKRAFSEANSADFDRLRKLAVGCIRNFTISKYRHKVDHESLAIDVLFAMKQRLESEVERGEQMHHANRRFSAISRQLL